MYCCIKTPAESHAAIVPWPGFRVDLVAAEPLIRSPVAVEFDEDGRLYVAEYPEYNQYAGPNPERAGKGSIGKRSLHTFTATVWGRRDDKTFGFNWAKLLATGVSSGLSNAYYPAENRGTKLTLERMGLSYLSEVGYNALKEFWPDIARRKKKS